MKPVAIDQLLGTYATFDAIGTHSRHIRDLIRSRGIESNIYYELEFGPTKDDSIPLEKLPSSPDRILIYHHSIASHALRKIATSRSYIHTVYHNVTPPEYFEPVGFNAGQFACEEGVRQLALLVSLARSGWADSSYNAEDLLELGMKQVDVLPILRRYDHLCQAPDDPDLGTFLDDGRPNILFVGRINPNKAHHDLITTLKAYHDTYDDKPRLILIGGKLPYYWEMLTRLMDGLELTYDINETLPFNPKADVILPGQLTDAQMSTLYRKSQLFLCYSDHEGFCVPLVEAMHFGLPIVAHRSSAVPETLGDGGVLVDKNDLSGTLPIIHQILTNQDSQHRRSDAAKERADHFSWPSITRRFDELLTQLIERF